MGTAACRKQERRSSGLAAEKQLLPLSHAPDHPREHFPCGSCNRGPARGTFPTAEPVEQPVGQQAHGKASAGRFWVKSQGAGLTSALLTVATLNKRSLVISTCRSSLGATEHRQVRMYTCTYTEKNTVYMYRQMCSAVISPPKAPNFCGSL